MVIICIAGVIMGFLFIGMGLNVPDEPVTDDVHVKFTNKYYNMATKTFKSFDNDGNDLLDFMELTDFLDDNETASYEALELYDIDKDGNLDHDELFIAFTNHDKKYAPYWV